MRKTHYFHYKDVLRIIKIVEPGEKPSIQEFAYMFACMLQIEKDLLTGAKRAMNLAGLSSLSWSSVIDTIQFIADLGTLGLISIASFIDAVIEKFIPKETK